MAEEVGTVKQGSKTTEHVLSWAAKIVGILMIVVGCIAEAIGAGAGEGTSWGTILMILGTIQSLLASLGYTAARSMVKMTATKAAAIVASNTPPGGPSGN